MKKGLMLGFILLLVLVFAPWRMEYSKFKNECKEYCTNTKHGMSSYFDCTIPSGGIVHICKGFKVKESCKTRTRCFDDCNAICFGLNFSTNTSNPLSKKLLFWLGR